ncbi:lysozyme-like protein [Hesseltinella vesiculosa]|uniref:Lysozyme-like protein n=1 Tax=Hesseltinella vesiculosa TaxID=101127 RepID=A0A1X2G2V1_9FUNG|nr:lysozyme-like protein [Hesseltinella vesiculosa]
MKSLSLLSLTLLPSAILAASNSYCQKQFARNEQNCAKFDFSHVTPDSQQCGSDGTPTSNTTYNGPKQTNCTTFYDIGHLPEQTISNSAARMAQLITNVFENGDTKMGYAYVENLGDCRGYTSGYIGFTTGTNDAYAVVQAYTKRIHGTPNPFQPFLGELAKLSNYTFGDPHRADVTHLKGFPAAWKDAACQNPMFVQTQLDVGHSMYLQPALRYAASVGVTSNLGKAIFYDTIVQHGWQYVEPLINLPRIMQLTGPRKNGESEKAYLTRFLTTRRQLVCCYPGDTWNESSDRMSDLQNLVDKWSANQDLKNKVVLKAFGATVTGKENMNYDTGNCKGYTPFASLPTSIPLPIPQCTASAPTPSSSSRPNHSKNHRPHHKQHAGHGQHAGHANHGHASHGHSGHGHHKGHLQHPDRGQHRYARQGQSQSS